MEVKFDVYEDMEITIKEVKKFGSSGHIILPSDWIGKKVRIIKSKQEDKKW